MIALDTSAIMAILQDEIEADACAAAIMAADDILLSAGTMAETLIVAGRRNFGNEAERLISTYVSKIIPLSAAAARQAAAAYVLWGKGVHPARLNMGDCFAYALAKHYACPLLYVGNDFAQTDIASVL